MKPRSNATDLWALVPVKRFTLAKRRLASVLDAAARAGLAEAMLRDVLSVLATIGELRGILVVTADEEAAGLARRYGAQVESDSCEDGTNAAVKRGMQRLQAEGRVGVVVVPGDVPLLRAGEVRAAIAAMADAPVVLVPAARDGGTGLFAARLPSPVEPCFGPDSFARHVAGAARAGIDPAILRLEGLGHDIDVAADLAMSGNDQAAPATRALLKKSRGSPRLAAIKAFEEACLT